jgi:hypothetical protein
MLSPFELDEVREIVRAELARVSGDDPQALCELHIRSTLRLYGDDHISLDRAIERINQAFGEGT